MCKSQLQRCWWTPLKPQKHSPQLCHKSCPPFDSRVRLNLNRVGMPKIKRLTHRDIWPVAISYPRRYFCARNYDIPCGHHRETCLNRVARLICRYFGEGDWQATVHRATANFRISSQSCPLYGTTVSISGRNGHVKYAVSWNDFLAMLQIFVEDPRMEPVSWWTWLRYLVGRFWIMVEKVYKY